MKNIILLLFIGLSGCASIMGNNKVNVKIDSDVSGANYIIKDNDGVEIKRGVTPDNVLLKTSKGYFSKKHYVITTTKDGYAVENTYLDPELSNWYVLGNLLIGGLVGWVIVDPITGAMYTFPDSLIARNGFKLDQKQVPANRIYANQDKTKPSRLYVIMSDDDIYKDCTIRFYIEWHKVADFKQGEAAFFYSEAGRYGFKDERIGKCPKKKTVYKKINIGKYETINILLQ